MIDETLEENQGEFIRRLGQALPECKFAVQGRTKRLKLPRAAEILSFYRWTPGATRPKYFIVSVLAVTDKEMRALADTASEFNQRQRELLQQKREAEETAERRGDKVRLLKRAAMVAAILVGSVFLMGPAHASTIATVEAPPAQILQTTLGILPEVPLTLSIQVQGVLFTLVAESVEGALPELPIEVFLAVGLPDSIHVSTVPEPGTAAMMAVGLTGLGWWGRRRS